MKSITTVFISFLVIIVFTSTAKAQDSFGYKTVDVGGEVQNYSKGYILALHFAYNFPIHHSVQFRLGYNNSNWGSRGRHDDEQGDGFGFSMGYRYYFLVRPHGFFLGARTEFWRLNIDWQSDLETGRSKVNVFQPAIEFGYMFLINDEFFITPSISGGFQSNLKTEGANVGQGSLFFAGLSAGWKF